jgi:hypothetical protein
MRRQVYPDSQIVDYLDEQVPLMAEATSDTFPPDYTT